MKRMLQMNVMYSSQVLKNKSNINANNNKMEC